MLIFFLKDLENLFNVEELKTDEKILEKIRLIKTIELSLENEHSSFIRLSQLCSELVCGFLKFFF